MGPSIRTSQSGDSLNLKLMFLNRSDKRQTSAKPIKIMIFVEEQQPEAEEEELDDFEASTGDDEDTLADSIVFEVSYP